MEKEKVSYIASSAHCNPNYINKQVMPLLLTYWKLFSESYLKIDN